MTPEERERLREVMRQVDAIFRLEDSEPTAAHHAMDAAVLAGRITTAQLIEEMREHATQHKTMDGFIQSRIWTWSLRARPVKPSSE